MASGGLSLDAVVRANGLDGGAEPAHRLALLPGECGMFLLSNILQGKDLTIPFTRASLPKARTQLLWDLPPPQISLI